MQIDLAWKWTDADGEEHAPDKTVEVDDDTGRQLISDGRARPHAEPVAIDAPETPTVATVNRPAPVPSAIAQSQATDEPTPDPTSPATGATQKD